MMLLHRLASVLAWLFHRDRAEQRLDDDLQTFIEMSAADKVRDGVPPAEARRQAILELGGVEQAKERVRTSRHGASGRDRPGRALCVPDARQAAQRHRRRRADACPWYRREHGDLLHHRQPAPARVASEGA